MDLVDFLIAATRDAFEAEGTKIVQRVKANLGTPVGGSRKKKIRSGKGEHPRREKGKLQAEIYHEVTQEGDKLTLKVASPTKYASDLENMGRVVLSDVIEDSKDGLMSAISENLNQKE